MSSNLSLEKIKNYINDHIERNEKDILSFQKKLNDAHETRSSYAYVFSWSQSAFQSAANLDVLHQLLLTISYVENNPDKFEGDTDMEKIIILCKAKAAESARQAFTSFSTMPTSNLIDHYKRDAYLRYWANIETIYIW